MKHSYFKLSALAFALSSSVNVIAAPIEISNAFDYNAFIFENFTGINSDVEGKLAVGGNLDVTDFNVGLLLPTDLASSSLYVGGNLNYNRGDVHGGQTTVGGTITATQTTFDGALNSGSDTSVNETAVGNGGINAAGNVTVTLTDNVNGNITANKSVELANADILSGSVTHGTGFIKDTDSQVNGGVINGTGTEVSVTNLDFNAMINEVTDHSFDYSQLAANGVTTVNCWGDDDGDGFGDAACTNTDTDVHEIFFKGSENLNVFSIDSAFLSDPGKSITFDFSTTSYNIINVYGKEVELFDTGFFNAAFSEENSYFRENGQYRDNDNNVGQRHDGLYTNNILFNFVDATSLNLHTVGVKGSILAPYADVSFYNGHIDGNLIVKSLSSPEGSFDANGEYDPRTGQVNNYRFGAIDVSEPASAALLFGAGLFAFSRRKLKRKA
ncbi:choice-of-anchor A family protein [Alteromonas sp. A079]|uniref:choice-of-anchor A family protein n=1 Tax=Alteromonas sp. A079 TaxID=3410268 RepID=UPI003BA2D941